MTNHAPSTSTKSPSLQNYRSDIDGLRAIAVLAVLLFHADISLFRGGFIGVDVFFVISGFLITRIILRDAEQAKSNGARFSYLDFYIRRARRLFPALFATTAITFCMGAMLLVPAHLERFSGALLSSLVWLSNVFFWTEAGYFDADAHVKPLLHTWSLSVEEQFYFLWPALLVGLFTLARRTGALIGIATISTLSLLAAELMQLTDPSGAFFLMPFRIYEFGIGGLLVWLVERQTKNEWLLEGILFIGLAMIGASCLLFRESTVVPGWLGLIPCLGAACVIYAGQAKRLGLLLTNPASVYIGRISYSLYLVHWPIVVFYRYRREQFEATDQAIVIVAALFAAVVLHHLVEDRLRKPKPLNKSARKFTLGAITATILLALPAAHAWTQNGWSWRWNAPQSVLDVVGNFVKVRNATWQHVRNEELTNPAAFNTGLGQPKKVLLIGDSHSKDMFNAFHLNTKLQPQLQVRRAPLAVWCLWRFANAKPPAAQSTAYRQRCEDQTNAILKSKTLAQADWIMLSLRWRTDSDKLLAGALTTLRSQSNSQLAVFGRTAEFADIPLLALEHGQIEGLNELAASKRNTSLDEINTRISAATVTNDALYIDKLGWVCEKPKSKCQVTDNQDRLLIFDSGHWTLAGAEYYGQRMIASGDLKVLHVE